MNWRQSCLLSAVFAVLTALGLWVFPGHSFLLSDTQIYIPLFEHLRNPSLLPGELILSGAHLSYTIYDEVTLTLANLFQLDFETVLLAQQFMFRWVGYWGVFWMARVVGLSLGASVLSSALLWLGAFVYGPAIITTEFEPVPRGFAVPLIVASLGALAKGWPTFASALLALAFLYHPPAVWPVLFVALMARQWRMLSFPALAAFALFILSRGQHGTVEAQPFFSLIDDLHRSIQQTRAPYNWISRWPARHWLQFLLTGGLALAAFYRVRSLIPSAVQPYFRYLPIVGLATIPISYLSLEVLGWALFPQVQPMRALLYCHLLCQWLCILAAWREYDQHAWLKSFAWMIVPLSLSLRGDLLQLPTDQIWKQASLAISLLAALWIAARWPRPYWAWVASFLVALFLGEALKARAFNPIEAKPLDELATWAKQSTPIESTFFFPDLGRRLEPGIFRARAIRPVYVCWKQGGQVNYFPKYAEIWWERWSHLLAPGHPPLDYDDLRRRGIQYLVFTKENPQEELRLAYTSATYRVYRLNK